MATRRTRRSITTFTVLAIVSICLIAFSGQASSSVTSGIRSIGSAIVSPVVAVVDAVARPIGNLFAGALNYSSVTEENARLRADIGRLEMSRSSASFEQRQLREVAALQNVPYLSSLSTVTAATTAIRRSNFAATIQINKGTSSGVAVGMPVVGNGGLVGQVTAAGKSSATVRLVTDGETRVGAVFGRTSNYGVVAGAGATRSLSVNYVPPHTNIRVGQDVFTNGLDGAQFPAGIPIGRVTAASTPPNSLSMDIDLSPAADMSHLDFVDVVLWEPTP